MTRLIDYEKRTIQHPRGTKILLPENNRSLDHTIESFVADIVLEPKNPLLRAQYSGRHALLEPLNTKERPDTINNYRRLGLAPWFVQEEDGEFIFLHNHQRTFVSLSKKARPLYVVQTVSSK